MRIIYLFSLILVPACSRANLRDYDLDSFVKMVEGNISKALNFVLPTDNGDMTKLKSNRLYDYGTFDFIVVGGGSAGSLLTRRLTENSHWNVLLLEAGGNENDFSDIPGMSSTLQLSDMNWGYNTVPQKTCCLGFENNSCIAPRGKVLGGSSVLNGKMHVRGSRHDFELWAEMGNKGWSYEEVLPYFKKTENLLTPVGDPGYHQAGGLLSITQLERTPFTDVFLKGMEQLGQKELDYNGKEILGYNQLFSAISDVGISSAGRAFLENIRERSNFHLAVRSFVTKVIINKNHSAEAVEFIQNGKRYRAFARREVILSAGAFNSPQILMLSGVGPKEELKKFGIDVIQDLPVGKYLQDQPNFLGLLVNLNISQPILTVAEKCELYLNHKRPYTCSFNLDSTAFWKLNPSSVLPDIQHINIVPPAFNLDQGKWLYPKEEIAAEIQKLNDDSHNIIIPVILLHEKSIGSVTLPSANPRDFPLIDYNFFSDKQGEDIELMYQGLLKALELLETDAYKSVNATVLHFVPSCQIHTKGSRDYWYCVIRSMTSTIYHPVGTTRMGTSPQTSVVDRNLRVHGVNKLRVVDAGVMPEVVSGNTNAATYMIAEKAADLIKHQWS